MELKNYPMLEDHISASEVVTPRGRDILIYNTKTRTRQHPNQAVVAFLNLATGVYSFKQITEKLSQQSGESFKEIWPNLSALADHMVEQGLLKVLDAPAELPRAPPPSINLVHRLENVSLEITKQCNLRCKHCYTDAGLKGEDELTVEEIKKLIDHIFDLGVLSISFTGGEPLLHPHIFELMEYARKKPLTVLLFTNATLITPDIARKLKKLDVYRVNISIDGPDAQTHDEFRGVKGAFEKTIRGVNYLKNAGVNLHASTSLTKATYTRVKEILHLLKTLGISDSKIWPPTFSGRSEKEDIFLTPEEFRVAMEAMHEFAVEQREEAALKHENHHTKETFKYSKSLENCGVGWGALVVKCNGVVTPCPSFGEEFSLGTIREHSIADMWNNSLLLNNLRKMSVFNTEQCKRCQIAAVCKGGCIADVYMRRGEFSCYDPYMCIAFEITRDDFVPVEVDDISSSDCAIHFQSIE